MKTESQRVDVRCLLAAAVVGMVPQAQSVQVFTDEFEQFPSPLWGNETGNWVGGSGVYSAQNPFAANHTSLPFTLTDFVVDVDINDVADGGIYLRTDAARENGVLLVTGGWGWGNGDHNPPAGRALYWHTFQGGAFSGILNSVGGLFTPEVSDIHLRIEVIGDTYSVYLDGSPTPETTLTTSLFSSGRVGLYDYSAQTFDSVTVSVDFQGSFFRVVAPTPTAILSFSSDGWITWESESAGSTSQVQWAESLPGTANWLDFMQTSGTSVTTSVRVFEP